MISRREFGGHLAKGALALTLASTLELEGCSFITDIENWVPVGVAALKSILVVLQSNGITIVPGVQAAFNDAIAALNAIVTAAQNYAATTPPPVGTLQVLQAAFAAATGALENFLGQLQIPTGGVLSAVIAIAQIVFSTIAAFENKLPTPPAGAKSMTLAGGMRVAGTSITVIPVARSRRAFKRSFNSALDTAKGQGVTVPKQAYLPLSLLEHF